MCECELELVFLANAFSSLGLPKSSSSPFFMLARVKKRPKEQKETIIIYCTMYHYFCHARVSCNENLLDFFFLCSLAGESSSSLPSHPEEEQEVFKGIYDESCKSARRV